MKLTPNLPIFRLLICAVTISCITAHAGLIEVDEWGTGIGTVGQPTPAIEFEGNPYGLTYQLPFSGTPGWVIIFEPEDASPGDLIEFSGQGALSFYSRPPLIAPADTPVIPVSLTSDFLAAWPNLLESLEGDVFYTPGPNDPGWDPSGPMYHFVSDGRLVLPSVPDSGNTGELFAMVLVGIFVAGAEPRFLRS